MSSTDNRIVKMVFDNAQFKRGAAETKQSLAEVNKAVETTGKGRGLFDLQGHMMKVGVAASKMAVITTTALATITNKVVNAGINMAKSMTMDPIRQGFSEYESLLTKQNVIMNATGASATKVKRVLSELNHYSDQTIYSFGDMTDAITQFVNAGIPLNQSVKTIRGVANAAAYAGASSEEAGRAMYAFSQMMAAGKVGLQDWMQVENANMATQQFKKELIESGVAAGTLIKGMDGVIKTSKGTVVNSKNIRTTFAEQWATTEVLNDALSKYADTNTKLGKKAFQSATQVRTFSAFMDTLKESLGSGWSQIFTTLIGGLKESTNLWTGVSNTVGGATQKFFGWANSTIAVWKQMGGLQKTLEGFRNLLAPIGAIFDVVGAAWRAAFPSDGPGSGKALYDISSGFAAITSPLQKVADLIRKAQPYVTSLFEGIREGSVTLGSFLGYLGELAKKLGDIQAPGGGGFLSGMFDGLKEMGGDLLDWGVNAAKGFVDGLQQGFSDINFDTTGSLIGAGLLAGIFLAIRKLAKGGLSLDFGGGFLEGITDTFGALTDTLSALQAQIQSKTLMQIAAAIGLITASVVALSFVDAGRLTKSLTAISVGFGQLLGAMAILVKISGAAGFVKVPLIAASMVALSSAILILVGAIALMGQLKWETIGKGLAGIAGALVVIGGAMTLMPTNMPLTAAGLVLVGIALNAIAGAIAIMGNMEWKTIGKGLATVAGALVAIALGMNLMPPTLPLTAAGLVLVGVALNGIAAALKIMGSMSWKEIGKGLATLGGAMVILAIGLNAMSGTLLGSASLLVAAGAIAIIVPSLLLLSGLSWEEIGKGLVALAGGLAILAVAMYAMSGAIVGAAALLIIAPALMALSSALVVLGQLTWGEIGMALVALAGGLTVLAIAAALMTPILPALIGLGLALMALGAGLALAGAGVFLFATGLGLLGTVGGVAIEYLKDLFEGFIDILPQLGEGVANFFIAMGETIAENTPRIAAAFITFIGGMLDAAHRLLPKLVVFGNDALDAFIKMVVRNAPKVNKAGTDLIIGFLNSVAKNAGRLSTAGAGAIIAFIAGVAQQSGPIANAAADAIIEFVNSMANTIRSKSPELAAAMSNLGSAMIEGLINGIKALASSAVDKISNLAGDMISAAKNKFKVFSPSRVFYSIGQFVVQGLTNGIQKNAAAAIVATGAMVSGQIAIASQYINRYVQLLDQQAIAAQGRADGLAKAAAKAQQLASKTKSKTDNKQAAALGRAAEKARDLADAREARANAAQAAAERAEEFSKASTIDKAKMRSEDAQKSIDAAKAAERRAEAARVAAAALSEQAKKKGLTAAQRKALRDRAQDYREQAAAEAKNANAALDRAKKYAADALAYQKKAGAEAANAFAAQYAAEAKAAADSDAFDKMTDQQKAEKRRKDAAALQKQADADLAKAKKLAYTDLAAANELARKALDEADRAREYLKDAESYASKATSGLGTTTPSGTTVDLVLPEAAAAAFNDYSKMYDAAVAAAAATQNIEFNQYNTSPEALDPTTVYRQTNNQLTFALEKLDEIDPKAA